MGGHVIFSHYQYFDELLDTAVGNGPEAWNTLERVSYVWIKSRWVAYPFQNNISALDKNDQVTPLPGATCHGPLWCLIPADRGRTWGSKQMPRRRPSQPVLKCLNMHI